MTKRIDHPSGQAVGSCWICGEPLTESVDELGRVHWGCAPCRREIERLQGVEQRAKAPLLRRRAPGTPGPTGRTRRWERAPKQSLRDARRIALVEGLVAAAKATGLKYHTVWEHAKREGWHLRGRA